jgi:uncharacterized cupredoxin-like copper-binding protein
MRIAPRLLTALAIAAALALGACGDDDEDDRAGTTGTGTEAAAPAGEPVATVELEESDFKIEPKEPKVDKSGVIRFSLKNTGQAQHALEVETPEGESETEPFGPGETATLDVELDPGTYTMYCPVGDHEQRGMTGTITVGEGGGDSGTTTEEDEGGGGSDAHGGY